MRISSAVPTTLGPNSWLYGSTWLTRAAGSTIRSTVSASRCHVCGRGRDSASPLSPATTSRWSAARCAVVRQQDGSPLSNVLSSRRARRRRPWRGPGRSPCRPPVHPLQPLQRQEAAEVAVRTGQQHGADSSLGPGSDGAAARVGLVDELVQGQIGRRAPGHRSSAAVHSGDVGRLSRRRRVRLRRRPPAPAGRSPG